MSNIVENGTLSKWRNDVARSVKKLCSNLISNWADHTRIYERIEVLEEMMKSVNSGGGDNPVTLPDMFADANEGFKFNDTSLYAKVMVGYLQSRYNTIAEKYDDVTAKYNGKTSTKNTIAISQLEGNFTRVADSPNSGSQENNSCGNMGTWMYLYHLTVDNSTRRAVVGGASQTPSFVRGDWYNEFWKHTNPARQIAITDGYVAGLTSTLGGGSSPMNDLHRSAKEKGIYIINSGSYNNNQSQVFAGGNLLFSQTTADAYATVYCPKGISVVTESSSGTILNVASSQKPMVGFIGKPDVRDTVIYLFEFADETATKFVPKQQGEIIMTKHTYDQVQTSTLESSTYIAWPNRDINYYSR